MSTLGTSDPAIPNEKNFAYVESNKNSMLVDHEKNVLCDSYIVEFIHNATENYYEGGIYACRNAIIPSFLSMCLKSWSYASFTFLCIGILWANNLWEQESTCIGR